MIYEENKLFIANTDIIVFSPTGATKKVCFEIARGLNHNVNKVINLTELKTRQQTSFSIESDVLLIGAPVYGTRLYKPLRKILLKMPLFKKRIILVLTYGAISPGFAYQELAAICQKKKASIIGLGVFVGEHSYAINGVEVAKNRPNKQDLFTAFSFGKSCLEKLKEGNLVEPPTLKHHFYNSFLFHFASFLPRQSGKFFAKVPVLNKEKCRRCGKCYQACPMDAIDHETFEINSSKCFRCMSCVKICPSQARSADFKVKLIKKVLSKKRKESFSRYYL